jgi:hypothetical protein
MKMHSFDISWILMGAAMFALSTSVDDTALVIQPVEAQSALKNAKCPAGDADGFLKAPDTGRLLRNDERVLQNAVEEDDPKISRDKAQDINSNDGPVSPSRLVVNSDTATKNSGDADIFRKLLPQGHSAQLPDRV